MAEALSDYEERILRHRADGTALFSAQPKDLKRLFTEIDRLRNVLTESERQRNDLMLLRPAPPSAAEDGGDETKR